MKNITTRFLFLRRLIYPILTLLNFLKFVALAIMIEQLQSLISFFMVLLAMRAIY
jgi:hypothetical protein